MGTRARPGSAHAGLGFPRCAGAAMRASPVPEDEDPERHPERSIASALVALGASPRRDGVDGERRDPRPSGGPILVVTLPRPTSSATTSRRSCAARGSTTSRPPRSASLSPAPTEQLTTWSCSRARRCSDAQAAMLSNWVSAGGNLIALRPDTRLAGLLGIAPLGGATSDDANLSVDTSRAPGAGITSASLPIPRSRRTAMRSRAPTSVAGLSSGTPAVTRTRTGRRRARRRRLHLTTSRAPVVETGRATQRGRAWSATTTRSASSAPTTCSSATPRAASRGSTSRARPSPRRTNSSACSPTSITQRLRGRRSRASGTCPSGNKAAVVLTGDDHGRGSAGMPRAARSSASRRTRPPAHRAARSIDWQCVTLDVVHLPRRRRLHVRPRRRCRPTRPRASRSHLHLKVAEPGTTCSPFGSGSGAAATTARTQLAALRTAVGNVARRDLAGRTASCGATATAQPQAELDARHPARHQLLLLARQLGRRPTPASFTGSGFPQRFADARRLADRRLPGDDAAQRRAVPATWTTTSPTEPTLAGRCSPTRSTQRRPTTASSPPTITTTAGRGARRRRRRQRRASAHGVPIVSAQQMLTWLDGRNASAFQGVAFNGGQLDVQHRPGVRRARRCRPCSRSTGPTGALLGLSRNAAAVATSTRTVKGIAYAVFDAQSGSYVATYPRARRRRRRRHGLGRVWLDVQPRRQAARPGNTTTAPTRSKDTPTFPKVPGQRQDASASAAGACSRSASRPRRPPSSPWSSPTPRARSCGR